MRSSVVARLLFLSAINQNFGHFHRMVKVFSPRFIVFASLLAWAAFDRPTSNSASCSFEISKSVPWELVPGVIILGAQAALPQYLKRYWYGSQTCWSVSDSDRDVSVVFRHFEILVLKEYTLIGLKELNWVFRMKFLVSLLPFLVLIAFYSLTETLGLRISAFQGPDDILGLGITGGINSPSGDKPVTISYIQPGSAAGRARLKVWFNAFPPQNA